MTKKTSEEQQSYHGSSYGISDIAATSAFKDMLEVEARYMGGPFSGKYVDRRNVLPGAREVPKKEVIG